MQELTLTGLSEDGKSLVLVSTQGVEFSVPVDKALRDALRGDQSRLGQLEMKMENTLRPKDIQSRIRSGDTAEQVAAAANSSVDRIMVYAGPVLAERAHIARSAQLASIRRKNADGATSARTLTEAAPHYFREAGTHPDDVEWDAWRRDDGRWTVVALFNHEGEPQRAEFTYDMPGRYVVAENAQARHLTGEDHPVAPAAPAGRRLSAVPSQDQLPLGHDLGDDALELVRDHADADWMGHGRQDVVEHDADHEPTTEISREEPVATDAEAPEQDAAHRDSDDAQPAPEEHEPAPRPRKRGRAQVPSWDEIMFGSGGKAD